MVKVITMDMAGKSESIDREAKVQLLAEKLVCLQHHPCMRRGGLCMKVNTYTKAGPSGIGFDVSRGEWFAVGECEHGVCFKEYFSTAPEAINCFADLFGSDFLTTV